MHTLNSPQAERVYNSMSISRAELAKLREHPGDRQLDPANPLDAIASFQYAWAQSSESEQCSALEYVAQGLRCLTQTEPLEYVIVSIETQIERLRIVAASRGVGP